MTTGKRWMNWHPEMLEAHPETEPTKPTKRSYVGSEGTVARPCSNIRGGDGPGCPLPENVLRPIADRRAEALELLGALTHFFNVRAEALEAAGMTEDEANRVALIEAKATGTFRRWVALG